jgi:hypothetical protein
MNRSPNLKTIKRSQEKVQDSLQGQKLKKLKSSKRPIKKEKKKWKTKNKKISSWTKSNNF